MNITLIKSISNKCPVFEYVLTGNDSFLLNSHTNAESLIKDLLLILEKMKKENLLRNQVSFDFFYKNVQVGSHVFDFDNHMIGDMLKSLEGKHVNEVRVKGKGIAYINDKEVIVDDLIQLKIISLDSFYISITSNYDIWLPYNLEGFDQSRISKLNRSRLENLINFLKDKYSEKYEIEPEWENRFIKYNKKTFMPMNLKLDEIPLDIYSLYQDKLLEKLPLILDSL